MKRIVILTEEEKKRYSDRARHAQELALQRKGRKGNKKKICPVCRARYSSGASRSLNCAGYCSLSCAQGRSHKPKRSEKRKRDDRQQRQIKRQIRIKPQSPIDFYDSREWKELRFKVLRKYGFKCMACGAAPPKIVLHIDHIKPRSKYPQLELVLDNLQVLCAHCNIGKCNYSEEDLRPKNG